MIFSTFILKVMEVKVNTGSTNYIFDWIVVADVVAIGVGTPAIVTDVITIVDE